MPLFSRFKNKGAQPASKKGDLANGHVAAPAKPRWAANWSSKSVVPEEVEELIHACTAEMKSRAEALDAPFLLLPFRPHGDPSNARTFVRNFFKSNQEGSSQYRGASLQQELRLTEPIVLCSIMKWCWSRMPGGVVTWPVYDGFQIGEKESSMARNAFDTFVPISADSSARKNIIFDFYDLLAAVAAHGKMNGLGGRKLSRLAGWWAFEHTDDGKGFEGGYRSWCAAADASSHLFFAYLRTLSPEEHPSMSLIERIPRSLQALLASTEYPPETPILMQKSTPRVIMLVEAVSPTPFALLRRAKHFEFRDRDHVLREYSEFEDPVDALTDECKRVLFAISSTNSSAAKSRHRNIAKTEESWSAFQNTGFADLDEKALQNSPNGIGSSGGKPSSQGLQSEPQSRDASRPMTPSWADFMASGFAEDDWNKDSSKLLMPPDKVLPPLGSRAQSPLNIPDENDDVAPGELAAITNVELDDAFWWVWMTSLAGEEPPERKAVFGRCSVIETSIRNGRWLIMEEQVKGASPDAADGAYIAKKKGLFSFTKRGKLTRKRSSNNKTALSGLPEQPPAPISSPTPSRRSLAPDQQSKIRQAAEALKKRDPKDIESAANRRRFEDSQSNKTNSMLTMGALQSEAGPAMKWTNAYDRSAIRAQYLGDHFAGTGVSGEDLRSPSSINVNRDGYTSSIASPNPAVAPEKSYFPKSDSNRELPALPKEAEASPEPEKAVEPQRLAQEATLPPRGDSLPVRQEADKVYVSEASPAQPSGPMDKEIAVQAPARPAPSTTDHPAYRQASAEEPTAQAPTQYPAAVAAQRAMQQSNDPKPEAMKSGQAKLKKQPGGGGIKKLFGRKKDHPNRQSVDGAIGGNGGTGLAPPDQTLSRRMSAIRKKPAPTEPAKETEADVPHPTASELEGEPVMPESFGSYQNSATSVSHAGSQDQNAEQEFASFDQQGPVDMPASEPEPETSTPDLIAPQAQRKFNVNEHLASKMAAQNEHEGLEDYGEPIINDAQSEATMEEPQESIADSKDRWAIIRENAARRAAARQSEEQSSQSRPSQSGKTDDGETSGEETIESRVARIKARVAELTGGMDNAVARR